MYHWICFLSLLRMASCLYVLHREEASFERALDTCQRDGYLTDMAIEEEAAKIISRIEESNSNAGTLQFWVGLRKSKLDCVLDELPLKGFKWTVSDSSHTNVTRWSAQPAETCISVLCGLLVVEYSGKKVTNWGWNGSSCKEKHPFICRLNKEAAGKSPPAPECGVPHIFELRELSPVEDNPNVLQVHCLSNKTFALTCHPEDKEWKVGDGSGEVVQLCLACNPGFDKDDAGVCVDVDECQEQPCQSGCVNTAGSYVCTCDAALGFVPGDGRACKKLAAPLDAPSASTVRSFPLTRPFPQATAGKGGPPPTPTPSPGPQTTASAAVIMESQTSILISVLVAALLLVILVGVICVVAKCCLQRRSRKMSRETGEKSKETVALKSTESSKEIV